MKKILKALCASVLLAASVVYAGESAPKNIILFIGDGMGIQQVTAAKVTKGTLEMERCPVAGWVTTWSASSLVTDSAAAATALATGVKTKNGMIGLDPQGTPLKNLFEYAKENGKSVGVSVTCPITHATPAGFLAHVLERGQASDIAAQIAAGEADVLFGGGLGDFTEGATPAIRLLREKMKVALTPEEFRKIKTPTKAAALLYPAKPPKAAERTISLKEQTQKALEILAQNPQGFVLLVEGSAIDWAGHENNAEYLIGEAVDFDNAVGAGLDFAAKNGETLVLVTADHETGGFAVLGGSVERRVVDKTGWVLGNHTASIVPLFAAGLGCELFSGFQDNTDIAKKMIALVQKPVEKKTLQNEPSEK